METLSIFIFLDWEGFVPKAVQSAAAEWADV